MARKGTPSASKIVRTSTVAYARKKGNGDEPDDEAKAEDADAKSADTAAEKAETPEKLEVKEGKPKGKVAFVAPADAVTVVPKDPPPVDIARTRTETVTMPMAPVGEPPAMPGPVGEPPAMPTVSRTSSPAIGTVESPTFMPSPNDIPTGHPDDAAAPPGLVPRGDSRSLRRAGDFALVYRVGSFVISRFGAIGTRGQWRVVEYPTPASASHAYAKECSHFVSEGFSDYRE